MRVAARRKLEHELNIKQSDIHLSDFTYLTRIHYLAPSDGMWGEHEGEGRVEWMIGSPTNSPLPLAVDYILFLRKDVDFAPAPNEVKDTKWVTPDELRQFIAGADAQGIKITPWFRLIVEKSVVGGRGGEA